MPYQIINQSTNRSKKKKEKKKEGFSPYPRLANFVSSGFGLQMSRCVTKPTICPLRKALKTSLIPRPFPPSISVLTVLRRYLCCGSLLPVFGVRFSVTFHLTCVHIIFSSVLVSEWPTFCEIAAHSVDPMFSLHFDYL